MITNRKLTPLLINSIKILRAYGESYDNIAKELEISSSTAFKYGNGVFVLPPELRKDPWDEIKKLESAPLQKFSEKGEFKSVLKEKEYWQERCEEGTPFDCPPHVLDYFSLDELKEMMNTPTDYISPLDQTSWYNYYIAPMTFRGVSSELCNTQIIMDDFLDNHRFALVIVFRGVGKTVKIEGRVVRVICENRENSYAFQSESIERSSERLSVVANHLMVNKRLIAHYGYLPLDKGRERRGAWRANQITIKKDLITTDPTLKAVSWKDTRLLGGHFNGIFFDDPWSSKLEENSEKNKDRWFRWYDSTLVGCMEPDAWQHMICTRKGLYDIYRELMDRGMFSVYIQPAIWEYPSEYEYIKNEQGKIVDVKVLSNDWHISDDGNGRFSIEFLLLQKASQGQIGWEMEYQLNPIPEKGIYFNWDNLQFIESLDDFYKKFITKSPSGPVSSLDTLKFIGSMDMAFGKSEKAHYTAFTILTYHNEKFYFLQLYLKRAASKMDKVRMIQQAKREFPFLRTVYIEADLQQSAYVNDIKEEIKKLNIGVTIEEVYSRQEETAIGKGDIGTLSKKHARIIAQVDEIIENKQVVINRAMRYYDEFEREFREFPRSQFDDVMDAWGNGISKLKTSRFKLFGFSG